ncbi:hypothetical protein EDD90_2736 [Streptomyces sp. Ag109_O5-1]|uniref:hypothetical protein n=1 Tax=Streptomyces sp. Ag109_O5-1 TaxID=1938851 RepID=UPI000F50D1BD|nr:hypothetical protein [Streptomyces sp. Ag109_O5-1]RPE39719.1 hypothetical protein EDD90_2736 [Streptomyces sp. Ag109_O5-1]
MTSTVRAAARKTATATKVYIHVDCTCTRVNGTVLKAIDTVAGAEAYAAENGFTATYCKTSLKPAAVETLAVEEPAVEAPAGEEAPVVVEEPAVEEEAPVEEPKAKPASRKRAPKKEATEEAPVAEGPSFDVEVNNKDQYGKQRRVAVEAIAEALGATTTYTSVKNKHKTGNDAFIVTVTGGRPGVEVIIRDFVGSTAAESELMARAIADAKAAAKAVDGATANDVQKAWKKAARDFIATEGEALAARVAVS